MTLSADQERLVAQAEKSKLPSLQRGQLRALAFGVVGSLTPNERDRVTAAARKQDEEAS